MRDQTVKKVIRNVEIKHFKIKNGMLFYAEVYFKIGKYLTSSIKSQGFFLDNSMEYPTRLTEKMEKEKKYIAYELNVLGFPQEEILNFEIVLNSKTIDVLEHIKVH